MQNRDQNSDQQTTHNGFRNVEFCQDWQLGIDEMPDKQHADGNQERFQRTHGDNVIHITSYIHTHLP